MFVLRAQWEEHLRANSRWFCNYPARVEYLIESPQLQWGLLLGSVAACRLTGICEHDVWLSEITQTRPRALCPVLIVVMGLPGHSCSCNSIPFAQGGKGWLTYIKYKFAPNCEERKH